MRIACPIAVALLVVGARGSWGALPFTVSKQTTDIVGPLHADGTPDYVAALNERCRQGVTPENNGFVLWAQVSGMQGTLAGDKAAAEKLLQLSGAKSPADGKAYQGYFGYYKERAQEKVDEEYQAYINLNRGLWRAEAYPMQAAHLKAMDEVLDEAVRAMERPKWWSPYVSLDGRSMSTRTDPLNSMGGEISYIVGARATMRAEAGDFDGFLRDAMALKHFGSLVGQGTLFDRVQAFAIERRGNDALGAALGSGKLTEAQCDKIAAAMEKLPAFPSFEGDVTLRWTILDDLILAAMGNADLLKVAKPEQNADSFNDYGYVRYRMLSTIDRTLVDWDAVLKTINAVMDEAAAVRSSPTRAGMSYRNSAVMEKVEAWTGESENSAGFVPTNGEMRAAYSNRVAMGYLAFHLGDPAQWEDFHQVALLHDQMTRVLLAAAKARAKTGKWVGKLEELVPAYLERVPEDIFAGEGGEIRYVVQAGGAMIYSLGRNGQDNQGKRDDVVVGPRAANLP